MGKPKSAITVAAISLLVAGCAEPSDEERATSALCQTLNTFRAEIEAGDNVEILRQTSDRLDELEAEMAFGATNSLRVERMAAEQCGDAIDYWNEYDAQLVSDICDATADSEFFSDLEACD